MQTCTRRLTFAAGHRVLGHEGKCRHLHGHNYTVEIEAIAPSLDALGRVVDFGVLKARVGGWIDTEWDHAFLVSVQDHEVLYFLREKNFKHYVLPFNPTAENIAVYVCDRVCPRTLHDTGVTVRRVKVIETENCWAEACTE